MEKAFAHTVIVPRNYLEGPGLPPPNFSTTMGAPKSNWNVNVGTVKKSNATIAFR
jgi:hypothetical protein